ncbi:MAG: hypothetical protein MHPSP_004228, partial [Paramarteilia canceri]
SRNYKPQLIKTEQQENSAVSKDLEAKIEKDNNEIGSVETKLSTDDILRSHKIGQDLEKRIQKKLEFLENEYKKKLMEFRKQQIK